jgi:branched-subunit amino acid transport protein
MPIATFDIWLTIIGLAIATFLIRFSFIGILGGRKMPTWLLMALRYVPVTILPALVAPAIIWPEATSGVFDPMRASVAALTFGLAWVLRNPMLGFLGGLACLIFFINAGGMFGL